MSFRGLLKANGALGVSAKENGIRTSSQPLRKNPNKALSIIPERLNIDSGRHLSSDSKILQANASSS